MCHVSVTGAWLTPISSRAQRSKGAKGNGAFRGVLEMEGSSGFTAKSWDCPTSGAYLCHKLVGRRGQWWSSHAPVAENVPPPEPVQGMVDTPRLQLSLPAQMRDENYKLVINSMSVNNGISLKDLSHCERPRNIILKVQSFGATNYLGFCVALLPSGMMAGVWEHVSGWHRVGFPVRNNPDQILQGSSLFHCC